MCFFGMESKNQRFKSYSDAIDEWDAAANSGRDVSGLERSSRGILAVAESGNTMLFDAVTQDLTVYHLDGGTTRFRHLADDHCIEIVSGIVFTTKQQLNDRLRDLGGLALGHHDNEFDPNADHDRYMSFTKGLSCLQTRGIGAPVDADGNMKCTFEAGRWPGNRLRVLVSARRRPSSWVPPSWVLIVFANDRIASL